MLPEYEAPFDKLLSQIIPDHALSDRSGRIVSPHEMVNKVENLVENGRWIDWPENTRPGTEHDVSKALNRLAQAVSERCDINLIRKYSTICEKTEDSKQLTYLVIGPDLSSMELTVEPELISNGPEMPEDVSSTKVQKAGGGWNEGCKTKEESSHIDERTWKTAMIIGKIVSTDIHEDEAAITNLVDCVQEVFATQDNRLWLVTWTLTNVDLVVYVFDRSGVIVTEKINIDERKEVFLRFVVGVLFVDEKYLGYDPTIKIKDGKRYITVKQFDDTHTELEIVLTIFRNKNIQGRGTTVWYVEGCLKYENDKEGSTRRGYIVKDNWVDMSNKTKEHVILEKLRGFRNTPYMCTHEDMGGCTDYFRQGGVAIYEDAKIVSREHHRVVLSTVGQPIINFKSSKELILSFMNIFLAIIDLRIVKNILHRDISVNNLLLIDMGNGKRDGCLIDFDYSVDLSDENTHESLTKRSGTVPFMAIEVLMNEKDFVHDYYHDIESAFYVLIWICLERSLGRISRRGKKDASQNKAPNSAILKDWDPKIIDQGVLNSVAMMKAGCISTQYMFKEDVLDLLAPEFDDIKDYLENLRNFIFKPKIGVFSKQRDPMADRDEICKIHEEAFIKIVAKGTERVDDSVVEDTADLASDSQQVSDETEERPQHFNTTSSIGQANDSSDAYSSSDSGPISTSNVSEGGSSSGQTSLQTSEGSVVSVPQTGSKRKQRPSGGPGNFVSSESKKQKGSHEI